MTRLAPPDRGVSWASDDIPPEVHVRPAYMEEESAVATLRRASGWSSDTVAQQFRAMRERRREIWIAEVEGYVVGTVTIEWTADDRLLADGRTRAHISNLVVHPTYRRRGVGRSLMAAAENAARLRGCTVMTIGVDRGNDYPKSLYERRGYTFVKDINVPWGQVHILERRLFS